MPPIRPSDPQPVPPSAVVAAGSHQKAWERALAGMRDEVGAHEHENWLLRLSLLGIEAGAARIAAPNGFISGWVERHYGDALLRRVARELPEVGRLVFVTPGAAGGGASAGLQASGGGAARIDGRLADGPVDGRASALAAASLVQRAEASYAPTAVAGGWAGDAPSMPLDPRFTFERFVVGKPNELANAAARRVAELGPVSFNPLFLYSASGLGKTHLMHAMAWRLAERAPELRVALLTAEQFMYRFIQALRSREMISFKQLFRSVDVLMIDDVQFIAGKDSTQEEFFHTFNALVDQGKQVVISGDRNPVEMDGLEERIKSRLQWGLVVDLHPTDYELRLGILQSKIETLAAQHPEVQVNPRVLEFLAHRISSNVRVLEGALTRLMAFASLVGRPVDLDMTQECLADVLRASDRKVTVEEIQRKVASHFNLRLTDMLSARRSRAVARPRQIAMYLAKTLTSKSLPDIGRRFGGRDHTTVIHAVKTIERLKETDAQIAEDVELLRRMMEA